MPLSVRVYEYLHCGLVIQRDHNGSLNILEEGFKAVGRAGRVIRRAPQAPGAVGSSHDTFNKMMAVSAAISGRYNRRRLDIAAVGT